MDFKKSIKTVLLTLLVFSIALPFYAQEERTDPSIGLIPAVASRDLDRINTLLAVGADINVRNESGMTPLIIATYFNYPEVVNLLIKKGANLNATYIQRGCCGGTFTALDVAKKRGYLTIMLMLQKAASGR